MDFQITALSEQNFFHLFGLTDEELASQKASRQVVTENPGTPCRVSMQDAEVGETVILLNYQHQSANSPYPATHAIFIRENVKQADIAVNDVPESISSRLVSVRFFDHNHMMTDADVVDGYTLASVISNAFENKEIEYAHLHYAKPRCFAASVHRFN